MKLTILISLLFVSFSFSPTNKSQKPKHVFISDNLDFYRIRDNHNLNEFDKKVNIILTKNSQ